MLRFRKAYRWHKMDATGDYHDIMKLVSKGHQPIGDLRYMITGGAGISDLGPLDRKMLRNLLINAGEIPLLIDHHRMYIDTLLQVHWEPLFISNNQHTPRFLPTTRSYAERILEWKRYDDDWVPSVEEIRAFLNGWDDKHRKNPQQKETHWLEESINRRTGFYSTKGGFIQ